MLICRTRLQIPEKQYFRKEGHHAIGFVPTMGALHEGHASLVRCAKETCSFVAASVFVNPFQFNNPEDLRTYPRTPEEDLALLESMGCDLVFIPDSPDEVFSSAVQAAPYTGGLPSEILEGAFRPGHFEGVFKVVRCLFDLVSPDKVFFGEKDFQQFFLIREMSRLLFPQIDIIQCPTLREPDGLAMSSRNKRLSPDERREAALIYRGLQEVAALPAGTPIQALRSAFERVINQSVSLRCEYLALVNEDTFTEEAVLNQAANQRLLTAVYCNATRLIDTLKVTMP